MPFLCPFLWSRNVPAWPGTKCAEFQQVTLGVKDLCSWAHASPVLVGTSVPCARGHIHSSLHFHSMFFLSGGWDWFCCSEKGSHYVCETLNLWLPAAASPQYWSPRAFGNAASRAHFWVCLVQSLSSEQITVTAGSSINLATVTLGGSLRNSLLF